MKKIVIFIITTYYLIFANDIRLNSQILSNYSYNSTTEKHYFENWSSIRLSYNKLYVEAEYQAHLPPFQFSMDSVGSGIYKTTIAYSYDDINIKAGDFFHIFGRGIVLNSFVDKNLRWDNSIRGVMLNYKSQYFTPTFIVGKVRTLTGKYDSTMYGMNIEYNNKKFGNIGVSSLYLENGFGWGGIYNKLNIPLDGEQYFEVAINDFKKFNGFIDNNNFYNYNNIAIFENISIYLPFALLKAGYKNYSNFEIIKQSTYNSLPTLIKKHLFTLTSRKEHIVEANDEKGYLFESSPIWDYDFHTNISYAYSYKKNGNLLYRELLLGSDFTINDIYEIDNELSWQEKPSNNYYTIATSISRSIFTNFSFKAIFEHQYATSLIEGNGFTISNKYYNQIYTLSITKNRFATISLIDEYISNKLSKQNNYFGAQLDFSVKTSNISIFAGERGAGKICAGGICVEKPALKGVEAVINSKF